MNVLLKSDPLPRLLYRSLHEAIAPSIRDGRLRSCCRLAAEHDLVPGGGVSRITVRAALDGLARDKRVARHRSGGARG